MRVLHVVGARPNFMKAAPVYHALQRHGHDQTLVHTGQHYDAQMSDIFFRELGIPDPDESLNVGSGSHAQQTALIMTRFETVLLSRRPDIVLIYGDVNSTVAAALVCAKLGFPLGHVEAGLRSYDRSMPEEINRLITDQLAQILFTPSTDGNENLTKEGIPDNRIFFVGNVMIDTLVRILPKADQAFPQLRDRFSLQRFGLVTLHRPSNVDDALTFLPILQILNSLSRRIPLLFPVHPRTRDKWRVDLQQCDNTLQVIDPLGYVEFLALQKHAAVVLTDSGGIQEETTFLGTACLTLRENTERPITVSHGTNVLIGRNWDLLRSEFDRVLSNHNHKGVHRIPPLWDGHAADRIVNVLEGENPSCRTSRGNQE